MLCVWHIKLPINFDGCLIDLSIVIHFFLNIDFQMHNIIIKEICYLPTKKIYCIEVAEVRM